MKEAFTDRLRLSPANKLQLTKINGIVDEYRRAGYVLTLRQLYYQLVSRDVVPNNQKEYAKLSKLLTNGRMAGIVDWAAIEDRGRQPYIPSHWDGCANALEAIAQQYRIDRQQGQQYYIEVWVEKDALSNVFRRVTKPYGVNLMVNKGYSSTSAMYEAANRFKQGYRDYGEGILLYFGDHDASGKDMVRDVAERLVDMGVRDSRLAVINPALNMNQIEQYDPPENPAKQTDPRAKWYIEQYGDSSWELDALPPEVLTGIISDAMRPYINKSVFDAVRDTEAKQKAILQQYADDYNVDAEDDFDGPYKVDNSDMNFNNEEDSDD